MQNKLTNLEYTEAVLNCLFFIRGIAGGLA